MNQGGAPKGNDNAAKGREWRQAIQRALSRYSAKEGDRRPSYRAGLDKIADELVKAAAQADRWAIEEIGNRADGKPAQSVTVAGDEDKPLMIQKIERVLVRGDTED